MTIQTKWPLRHDGVYYESGEIVSILPPDDEQRLVQAGLAVMFDEKKTDVAKKSLSLEEFGKLKADEQKSFLEGLNIQAAAKEDQRLKQYEAWLAKDSATDEL
ncbi:hypothetical protein [Brevibacillus parabrevis]|uniref:Uncharacterized protein n=1 Tax=Brevibacillus parabrevis TaxID=54914 RepID=A0A4Y3PLA7_BREPA|nr:hypothetical protein [Brevibacillus parabrevis]RNB94430.1 hypothetical protein EDM60_18760 [Brevibacillus parabrevis]GEB35302.1 hypothetical protein BPA01_48820 [Brevibacillus parabrevis]